MSTNVLEQDKKGLSEWFNAKKSPEIIVATAIIGILLMLVLPLPSFILDLLLAINISSALIILLVALYITKPLEFGVFPTVLLLTTLYRLSLNVATTRGILLHGNDVNHLSQLVMAFGNLVVGGNFVIGFVIFVILMIINFMVITKGSGRIAEVAARFTLDAMPGKQMAIDAELNAGHINAEEARKHRKTVENEADFYGSMDGASKFVRGDAIAGLIITAINMIVGLIIGMVQYNMPIAASASRFTLLAVGDGLISSLPSLMISTAAGIIVTRATSEGNLSNQLFDQIKVHPKAFWVSGSLMLILGMLPGFPKIAFFSLGAFLIWLGQKTQKQIKNQELEKQKAEEKTDPHAIKSADDLDTLMSLDMASLEVGGSLVSYIDPSFAEGEVVSRIINLRKQMAQELGIIIPKVQVRDNLQLELGQYCILIKGVKVATGHLMKDYFLAMDSGNIDSPLDGIATIEPVFGQPGIWIHKRYKDDATFKGYIVADCASIMVTHLQKILKENIAEFLTRQDVVYLIDKLKETNPKVVEEVINVSGLNIGDVVKVLQHLLKEDVSIRDFLSIFECLADNCRSNKNPEILGEQCRKILGRSIIQKYLSENNVLNILVFDRTIEDTIFHAVHVSESGYSTLQMDSRVAQNILTKLNQTIQKNIDEQPILACQSRIRSPFQKLCFKYIPNLIIIAFDEIPNNIEIKTLEIIK